LDQNNTAGINAAGEWIYQTETTSMHDMFDLMTIQELEAYAQTGVLPEWFRPRSDQLKTETGKMRIIEQARLEGIESYLQSLGGGNQSDNMNRLRRFEHHCLVALTEEEFLGLVFLQNDEVLRIAPLGFDRTLRAVAERSVKLGQPRLSANWDLAENLDRMRERIGKADVFRGRLVICEARDGEEQFGPFYLQDGSHRALARATLLFLHEMPYDQQTAFCSTSRIAQAQ
jgi:hypothetical protein